MYADISGRVGFFLINIVVTFLLVVPGCGSEGVPPLRVGTNLWPGYEPLHLASELDYIDSSRIVLIDSTSPHGSIQGLRNGDLDAVALTLDEVLLLVDQGVELEVVLVCDFSNGGDAILATPYIESVEQLKGKRIGLESTALGSYLLSRALERNGMVLEDVERRYIKVSGHKQALQRAEVDAVVTFEPVRSELLSSGSRELFSSREIPHEIVDVLAVRKSYAMQYPQRVKELIAGWYRALDYFIAQPQAAAEIIGRRLHQKPNEVLQAFSTIQLPSRIETLALMRASEEGEAPLLVSARRLAATMQRQQMLHARPDVAALIQSDYLD
jgi:NitT/TauT family transport system substrate-binding protein